MTDYDFDLYVLGGGSGGVRASRIAATHGARVGVAEERYMGGTCVNVGCIPKKLLAYSAGFGHGFEDAKGYGWDCGVNRFSWPDLIRNKDAEISRLNGVYRRLMDRAGVTIHDSRATLVDAHTVEIAGLSCPIFRAANSRSPRTRRSICPICRAGCSSPAAAISRWNSPASSPGWGRR
jgi:glutathione reductase (NADPH)